MSNRNPWSIRLRVPVGFVDLKDDRGEVTTLRLWNVAFDHEDGRRPYLVERGVFAADDEATMLGWVWDLHQRMEEEAAMRASPELAEFQRLMEAHDGD
jgi:hypothetical protein